jgi:arylsulfatase A-like enzyme
MIPTPPDRQSPESEGGPGMSGAARSMRLGAFYGVIAWATYAIAECCFSLILAWRIEPSDTYVPPHVGFTALVLGVYQAIGGIAGGLLGLGLYAATGKRPSAKSIEPATFLPAATTFTIVAAFVVNLLAQKGFGTFTLLPLLMSVVIMVALLLAAGSSVWSQRLGFLTHPVVVCVLILGLPWITSTLLVGLQSVAVKAAAALLYPGAILSLSFGVQRVIGGRPRGGGDPARAPRVLASLFVASLAVVGVAGVLQRVAVPPLPGTKSARDVDDRPSVILITLDTVRADHLSLYGYGQDTTPNLKRFSKNATLYTRAIAASDMTLSSHASIFTSMYPSRHGTHYAPPPYTLGRPLRKEYTTLAEILSERGYLTMSVVANYVYLGRQFGLAQGFEYLDRRPRANFLRPPEPFFLSSAIRNALTWFAPPSSFAADYRSAEEINFAAFRVLDAVWRDDARFFLFVNYLDAHWPYVSPPPFDSGDPPPPEAYRGDDFSRLKRDVMAFERPLPEERRQRLESLYDLGIRYLDVHVGKLIAHLKELGLYEKSLIIITADHGEAFGERNRIGHGVSVYQDQVHVPLLIKYPYQSRGAIVSEFVSLVDIMPTILDVLGYQVPSFAEGASLATVAARTSRPVISESFPAKFLLDFNPRFNRIARAVFSGPFKFIHSTAGKTQLYDLTKDPTEAHDISTANYEMTNELQMQLGRWLEDVEAASRSSVAPDQGSEIGEADKERLRALGYIP